jgi:hypothetical protein
MASEKQGINFCDLFLKSIFALKKVMGGSYFTENFADKEIRLYL